MPLKILTIPCLADNYAFLLHDAATNTTGLVDAPEARPVLDALADNGWTLDTILLTHHHFDHIDAVPELVAKTGAKVVGAQADAHRLPPLDTAVAEGDSVAVGGHEAHVLDVSGHTVGHIAFHVPTANAVFTADSLMALGCGRLFEGTPEMMWTSLSKLAALPPETIVYSGHEYTAANAKFAMSVEPESRQLADRTRLISVARAKGDPTVPSALSLELATNPFLRAGEPSVKAAVGMAEAADVDVFAEIRSRKDNF